MTILIEAQYLPSIAYFSAALQAGEIVIEKHEHFSKQSYRNRCYIQTSQRTEMLIVPITSKHGKVLITDVRIDYQQKWLTNHWRAIQSAYGKAPFFEFYADDLEKLLFKKFAHLYDLNLALLSMCLAWLKSGMVIKETLTYEEKAANDVIDLRSAITPKNSGFLQSFFQPAVYTQVFGNDFVTNLSLIDLIFCVGPDAGQIVQRSAKAIEQIG